MDLRIIRELTHMPTHTHVLHLILFITHIHTHTRYHPSDTGCEKLPEQHVANKHLSFSAVITSLFISHPVCISMHLVSHRVTLSPRVTLLPLPLSTRQYFSELIIRVTLHLLYSLYLLLRRHNNCFLKGGQRSKKKEKLF